MFFLNKDEFLFHQSHILEIILNIWYYIGNLSSMTCWIGSHFLGSLSNSHYFPCKKNILTYTTNLQFCIMWFGIQCEPTTISYSMFFLCLQCGTNYLPCKMQMDGQRDRWMCWHLGGSKREWSILCLWASTTFW